MPKTRSVRPFRPYWELLAIYLRPLKWPFLGLAALMLASIGLQLLNPQIISGFINFDGVSRVKAPDTPSRSLCTWPYPLLS